MNTITVDELMRRMVSGEHIHLIDVREPHEYAESNLGGKLVPLGKIQTMQTEELDDLKEEEVLPSMDLLQQTNKMKVTIMMRKAVTEVEEVNLYMILLQEIGMSTKIKISQFIEEVEEEPMLLCMDLPQLGIKHLKKNLVKI